jgi:hypothetical protein
MKAMQLPALLTPAHLLARQATGQQLIEGEHTGMHYGFLRIEDGRPQVVATARRSVEGVRPYLTRDLPERDRWRHRGIPITTVERTLLDLAATLPDKALLRLTSARQLAAILDRTGARPGAGATRGCSRPSRPRCEASWRTACTT